MADKHSVPYSAETFQTPGQILKAARERGEYSQVNIAKRLCLSVQTIKDIEEDNYAYFKAEIYLRGYLRSYAHLLSLDSRLVLRAYEHFNVSAKRHTKKSVPLTQRPLRRARSDSKKHRVLSWLGMIALLILIGMIILRWQVQQPDLHRRPLKTSALTPTTKHSLTNEIKSIQSTQPLSLVQQPAKPTVPALVEPKPALKAASKPVSSRPAKSRGPAKHRSVFHPDYTLQPVLR